MLEVEIEIKNMPEVLEQGKAFFINLFIYKFQMAYVQLPSQSQQLAANALHLLVGTAYINAQT